MSIKICKIEETIEVDARKGGQDGMMKVRMALSTTAADNGPESEIRLGINPYSGDVLIPLETWLEIYQHHADMEVLLCQSVVRLAVDSEDEAHGPKIVVQIDPEERTEDNGLPF